MEIKTVGDLIPYRQSLLELWGKEEFQPVLSLLSSLKEEGVTFLRTTKVDAPEAELRARVATIKTQINLAGMFLELPAVVKEVEEQLERNANKLTQIKEAQEGGEI